MGLQISCGVCPEMSQKGVVREDQEISGPCISRVGFSTQEPNIRGAHGARSCAYVNTDPPKYPVAEVIGYLKGKSAIAVARQFGARKRNFNGERFWARGYAVSTVGFEEEQIRKYIRNQEQLDTQGSDEDGEF